jgi:hypothetical protein
MANALYMLLVVTLIATSQYIGTSIMINSTDLSPYAILFSLSLIAHAITAIVFFHMALAKNNTEDIRIHNVDTEINPEYPVEINPRTGKPYIMPISMRNILRVKALKREQDKRIQKTTE